MWFGFGGRRDDDGHFYHLVTVPLFHGRVLRGDVVHITGQVWRVSDPRRSIIPNPHLPLSTSDQTRTNAPPQRRHPLLQSNDLHRPLHPEQGQAHVVYVIGVILFILSQPEYVLLSKMICRESFCSVTEPEQEMNEKRQSLW